MFFPRIKSIISRQSDVSSFESRATPSGKNPFGVYLNLIGSQGGMDILAREEWMTRNHFSFLLNQIILVWRSRSHDFFFISTKEFDCNTIQCDRGNFSFENSFRFLKVLLFKAVWRMGRELNWEWITNIWSLKSFEVTWKVTSYVRALKVIWNC